DAQNGNSRELHAIHIRCYLLLLARWYNGRKRDLHRELRSTTNRGADDDLVIEHAGDAFDDRKAQSQAACRLGPLIEPVKFLKDRTFFRSRNAKSGIVNADAQPSAVATAADKHATLRGVFDCVGYEILQQSPQQTPVGLDRERAGCELEF